MTANVPAQAIDAVLRAAAFRLGLYAPSVVEDAAVLLAALYATGESHGVPAAEWAPVTSLPDACLDVEAELLRSDIPRTPQDAMALLDAVVDAVRTTKASTSRRVLRVSVPGTVRFGRAGVGLAVTISIDSGWSLVLDIDDLSPVVRVAAPYTTAGSQEVAQLAAAVASGHVANPFPRGGGW